MQLRKLIYLSVLKKQNPSLIKRLDAGVHPKVKRAKESSLDPSKWQEGKVENRPPTNVL